MKRGSPIHVMHTIANNDGVPYLSWFMDKAVQNGNIRLSFIILYPERPKMVDEIRAHGFACTWIRFDHTRRRTGLLKALPAMWWFMMRQRPDVVHGHLFDDSLPGMIAAWCARIKVRLITRQDSFFHWNYAREWMVMDRLIARLATRIIAVSEETREFVKDKERVPVRKVGLVHHGVPPKRFVEEDKEGRERLRDRFGLENAYPVVGTVARFIEWKGYRHIVEAARIIVVNYPKAKFLFCGSGEQQAEVRSWISEAGLDDHIILTGWVDRIDIPALYKTMDVYLHAADNEPFGFVFAEAMLSGVPVVSTPTGGFGDVVKDQVGGIAVSDRSGKALAEGVIGLLEGDSALVGTRGREIALKYFTLDRMWEGYMQEYENALYDEA